MRLLGRLRIGTKLILLLLLSALALFTLCGLAGSMLHQRMMQERAD